MNAYGADPAELVHRGAGADVHEVGDRHVPAQRRMRAENRLVADQAVVRHVHVIHEQVAVADLRDAAATRGAAMDRDELAENISGADLEAGRFTPVFQVLRRQANRRIGKYLRAVADRRVLDDRSSRRSCSCGRCARPGRSPRRARRSCPRRSPRRHATRALRIDAFERPADRRTPATASASITVWPSTSATAVTLTSGPRTAPSETISFS